MWSRNTYSGSRRRLVVAFDVGTTWSGISYSILDPGRVPNVEGVTRFPSSTPDMPLSLSKVPSVLYYDSQGILKAAGAATMSDSVKEMAYEEGWTKVEWFKLHLRPKHNQQVDEDYIPPLPQGKTVDDVLTDYIQYLHACALEFIEYAHGPDTWKSLSTTLNPPPDDNGRYHPGQGAIYVLSHPNGWEGHQQHVYSRAVVKAGLLPDDPESLCERLHFVTEGEASLHWALETLGSRLSKGTGFTVVDAGGGTIDVSSYRRKKKQSEERGSFDEIAPPTCYFQGSVFVTVRARALLKERLVDSEYYDDIDSILEAFDDTTKLRFRDPHDPQFVKFGGVGDNDQAVGVRFGQIKIKGEEVAALFKPAIECITNAILEQKKLASKSISHVVLVGGFVNNDYLFECVKASLAPASLEIHRLDNLPNKAVANGAVSFYLDHFVRVRMTKATYGIFGGRPYNPKFKAHKKQLEKGNTYTSLDGRAMISYSFVEMLGKNVRVSEGLETRYKMRGHSLEGFKPGTSCLVSVWSYTGNDKHPRFWGEDEENYHYAFTIVIDPKTVPLSKVTHTTNGRTKLDRLAFDLVMYFGLPSIRADIAWMENGVEKRYPAKLVYDRLYGRTLVDHPCLPAAISSDPEIMDT